MQKVIGSSPTISTNVVKVRTKSVRTFPFYQALATVPFYIFYFTVLQKDVIRDIMKLSHIGENMTSQELYTAIHKEYERLKSVLQTNDLNAIIEQTL